MARKQTLCRHFMGYKRLVRKEGNVLFNDALNTFCLRLYDDGNVVKHDPDSERRNPLPPLHRLLFPISSKGSFMYTILQNSTLVVEHWLELEIAH